MRCNKCNSEIIENSKFCQICGNPITSIESDVTNVVIDSAVIQPIDNNPVPNISQDPVNNISNNENLIQTANNINDININNQQQLNQITQEQPTQPVNNNQQVPNQNDSNKDESSGLKIVSTLLGVVGIVVMFFHSTIASIIFIIGIILGAVYKSKTKNKCFGLTLNIICLILNIIFFFGAVFIVNNTINDARKSAECAEKGGYMADGKCIGAIVEEDEETKDNKKEEEKDNNSNINDNSFNSNNNNENNTYIGLWSCKDNGSDTSMSIKPLDQIDESEYKIGLSFVNSQKYMITYSSSKWEKGTYTINLNKKDSTGFIYYDLDLTIGELYESGNYQILDAVAKKYQFLVDESYSRAFLIASDGSVNYSCYKD